MEFAARTLRPWLVCIGFGFFGWLIGASMKADSSAPEGFCSAPSATATTSSTSFAGSTPRDELFVAADTKGNITLHVENQPISWVLEQIQLQSGKALDQPKHLPQTISKIEPARCSLQQDSEELLAKIQDSDESERYDYLLQTHREKVRLPEEVLKTLYQTDESPHVRLLAYAYAMEGFSDDPSALRNALENAKLLPDMTISQDAQQRLAALTRLEREQNSQPWTTAP